MRQALLILFVLLCGACDNRTPPTTRPATLTSPAFQRSNVILLTPVAATKVREMSQGLDVTTTAYLRVRVEPAQTPQFRYLLDITEAADPTADLLGESQGVRIVVDRRSSFYLMGTVIDYRTTSGGSGFWFENPNAQTRPSEPAR